MHFITSKQLISLAFNQHVFSECNKHSYAMRYCKMIDDTHFEELSYIDFIDSALPNDNAEVLFYVHGFNNQPTDDILPRSTALQVQLLQASVDNMVVVPIIWPCDDGFGLLNNYWDDQKSAELSAALLVETLHHLRQWRVHKNVLNTKQCHIIAHSMGSRVLMKALDEFNQGVVSKEKLFNNVFLMAPDIANNVLEPSQEGHAITQLAQRVFCYYANDDFAMPSSLLANIKNRKLSRRLGHSGPKCLNSIPANVFAIDCDAYNNKFDSFKGHAYFLHKDEQLSPVFQHMTYAIQSA